MQTQTQPQTTAPVPATPPMATAPTSVIVPATHAPKLTTPPQSTTPVVFIQSPEPTDSSVKDFLTFGQAFAWPMVIIVLAVLFRRQIATKIENMASLKTPVAESTWNAQAGTVADLAEEIVEAEVIATPNADEASAVDPEPNGAGDAELAVEKPQTANAPRRYEAVMPDTSNTEAIGAVILLWNAVEQAVRELAASRNISVSSFLPAYRWLDRSGVIPPTTVELIEQLRKLRNDVVHLKGTDVDAEAYRRTVFAVLESLDLARRRPSSFFSTAASAAAVSAADASSVATTAADSVASMLAGT